MNKFCMIIFAIIGIFPIIGILQSKKISNDKNIFGISRIKKRIKIIILKIIHRNNIFNFFQVNKSKLSVKIIVGIFGFLQS